MAEFTGYDGSLESWEVHHETFTWDLYQGHLTIFLYFVSDNWIPGGFMLVAHMVRGKRISVILRTAPPAEHFVLGAHSREIIKRKDDSSRHN